MVQAINVIIYCAGHDYENSQPYDYKGKPIELN
jgi:hypothetical protein